MANAILALLLTVVGISRHVAAQGGLTAPPESLAVGEPFQLATAAPGTTFTDTVQVALITFTVVGHNITDGATAYFNPDSARLYWCDSQRANVQVSPNAVANKILLRVGGNSNVTNATTSTAAFIALGLDPNAASGMRPSISDADSSVALCGLLGFGPYNNTNQFPDAPSVSIAVSWTVVDLWYTGDIATPRPDLAGSATVQLMPAAAITVEFDDGSIWCRAAGSNFFGSQQRLEARVTQQVPPMKFRFFDAWGNPALTTLADTAVANLMLVTPVLPLITTNQGTATAVPAGSAYVTIPSTAIIGSASAAQLEAAQATNAKVLVQTALSMKRVAQGGRTFSSCGQLYLLSGYPQALSIAPADGVQQYVENAPQNTLPRFVVAVNPALLDQGIVVKVSPTDSLGNPVVVPGGVLRACNSLAESGCVACGVADSPTQVTLVPPLLNQPTNQSTAWFVVAPSSASDIVDLACWLQPGLDTGGRVVSNATAAGAAHSTAAVVAWQASNVRSTATIRFQAVGEFSCYDGRTPFANELSALDVRSMYKVFQNPNLAYIPFTTIQLRLVGAGGSRQTLVDAPAAGDAADIKSTPLRQWVVIPRSGFVNVPLGLMSVMSFGFTYSRTSAVSINMSRPICVSTKYRDLEAAVSAWLFAAGDNATFYYEQANPTVDQANLVNIDMGVCYGAALTTLDFVSAVCCDRNAGCGDQNTKSAWAYVLLVGALVIAFATAIGSGLYINSLIKKSTVHLSTRYQIDIADKTRVVLAHILAPCVLYAHMYFTFELRAGSAAALYWLDASLIALWGAVVLLRNFFPLYTFSKPLYMAVGTLLVCYQQLLLANATVWLVAALNLNVALLPNAAALLLIMVQVFWSVLWAQEQLDPGIFSDEIPEHSIVPVDAALGVEYFAIIACFFLFAINQIQDMSSFYGVVAAAVIVVFFSIYNFSISAQLSYALKKNFGDPAEEDRTSGGSALGTVATRRGLFLQRVFSQAKLPSDVADPRRQSSAEAPESTPAAGLISALSMNVPLLTRGNSQYHPSDDREMDERGRPAPPSRWADPAFGPTVVTIADDRTTETFGDPASPMSNDTDRSTAAMFGITIPPISASRRSSHQYASFSAPVTTSDSQLKPPKRMPLRPAAAQNAATPPARYADCASDVSDVRCEMQPLSLEGERAATQLATQRVLDQLAAGGVI